MLSLLAPIVEAWYKDGFEPESSGIHRTYQAFTEILSFSKTKALDDDDDDDAINRTSSSTDQRQSSDHATFPKKSAFEIRHSCVQTFYLLLQNFPTLKKYFSASGNYAIFQPIFQLSLKILKYWAPHVSCCLVWRLIHPSVFSLPWVSTLLADNLPNIYDVQYLWTKLFQICEDLNSKRSDYCNDGKAEDELSVGDKVRSSGMT
jgi:hypothetical protein